MITITSHSSPQFPKVLYFISFNQEDEGVWIRENIVIATLQWTGTNSFAADSKGFVDSFVSEAAKAGFEVKYHHRAQNTKRSSL